MSRTDPSPSSLAAEDVRAIVRILGEAVTIADAGEQRKFVMSRLAVLLKADAWVWGVSPLLEPGKQPVYLFHHTSGFDEERMARFLQAVDHPDSGAMTAPLAHAMIEAGSRVTRDLSRIISPERFHESPARPLWEAADVGPLLISIGPVPEVGTSVVGFYRHLGEADFDLRETRIMHILLTELPWLHHADLPHARSQGVIALSPRQRLVLNQLVLGASRRAIATHLHLAENTVHGYVKKIFRHFGVHSQAELIARFAKGDGLDR